MQDTQYIFKIKFENPTQATQEKDANSCDLNAKD